MKVPYFLGIDPGKSGALAIVDSDGQHVDTFKLKGTYHDAWSWLAGYKPAGISFAVLEKVASRPGQGAPSTFKFGESFGFCQGVLVASGIRFELVTPQKWQKAMGCMSKGDKNVTKSRAQGLFPGVKVTHAIADALILAEYVRRLRVQ